MTEMYQMGAQDSLYFITSTHYDQRFRAVSGGYWQHSGCDAIIMANRARISVGYRKLFFYSEGQEGSGIRTEWRMRECRLLFDSRTRPKVEELVLCKVYKASDPFDFYDDDYCPDDYVMDEDD